LVRLRARRDIFPESELSIRYYTPSSTGSNNDDESDEEMSKAFHYLLKKYGIDCINNCVCGKIHVKRSK